MEPAKRRAVYVVGVGLVKFLKPSASSTHDYPDMAKEAGEAALADAGLTYKDIQQAVVGYVYGDSTCGQRAVYNLGLTGIPIYNVNNNCATGSTALFLAKQLIEGGNCDCALALGFEKMQRGSLVSHFNDRTNPLDKHAEVLSDCYGIQAAPLAPQMFAAAACEHMEKYGTKADVFGKIAEKNHRHSANNPYSQMKTVYSVDEVMKSRMIQFPLTLLQCCPTSDGSAAAILCSEKMVQKYNLQNKAVKIVGMEMRTDFSSTFKEKSCIKMVGYDMTKAAADSVYSATGIKPTDVDVVELHDCFSANELISYEALGLCAEGEGANLVESGNNTYGGKYVINPSGGLISKGHPLGASGLAQCAELCWQLRNMAGKRQVPNAKTALQHNIGLGGAVVVGLYQRGFHESPQLATVATAANSINSETVFERIKENVDKNGPSMVNKVKAVFRFKITDIKSKGTKFWTLNLKDGSGSLTEGQEGKTDCTITMADKDFVQLSTGKLNPQMAFMGGKLKISGNMAVALKLRLVLPQGGPKANL
ncbi:uncharacterized protein TRIADDRAFT_59384 [Trichoplax adhaerens]|uniref:Sterol carrier protein 2 n=1 Tax=Trichoplax adhaerens TaxID=10228 RepID=B3S4X7_TRIAD|nr:hypothetical protein TRIADDRAFT_59384 [Trichoplax adhaerens]EDV22284.1 hypothetical protein TRIADDRAFT_59384 [Trichoplax adhaerens]|eukprot:XP_002115439.1 hypothetical protein TRIADDRAFT_59384 [Trichoplax adhaerens]